MFIEHTKSSSLDEQKHITSDERDLTSNQVELIKGDEQQEIAYLSLIEGLQFMNDNPKVWILKYYK